MEGVPYLTFMLPGLMAMSGMNQSLSISAEINISRFLTHFFEEYLLSPARNSVIVIGNILYGMTKGLGSFFAVLLIGFVFGSIPAGGLFLIGPVLLNSFMFASLGIWISLLVKTHRDLNSFMSFVITPMSFIAGTFFSPGILPLPFRIAAEIIPLTHSSIAIRSAFMGKPAGIYHYAVILTYTVVFYFFAVRQVRRAVL
jgi:ABC-type multidrug transport system permease subunit